MNAITKIKKSLQDFFAPSPYLRDRYHRFTVVTGYNISFTDWKKLRTVDLEDVRVRILEFDIFPDTIETLFISHSIISEMDINILLPNLRRFTASGTRTRDIRGIINLPRLNSLSLMGCFLTHFDDLSLPENIEHVNYKVDVNNEQTFWQMAPLPDDYKYGLEVTTVKDGVREVKNLVPMALKSLIPVKGYIDLKPIAPEMVLASELPKFTLDGGVKPSHKMMPSEIPELVADYEGPFPDEIEDAIRFDDNDIY